MIPGFGEEVLIKIFYFLARAFRRDEISDPDPVGQ